MKITFEGTRAEWLAFINKDIDDTDEWIELYKGILKNVDHDGYKYIATDKDWSVFIYTDEPFINCDEWTVGLNYKCFLIGKLDQTEDWKNSLRKIEDCL